MTYLIEYALALEVEQTGDEDVIDHLQPANVEDLRRQQLPDGLILGLDAPGQLLGALHDAAPLRLQVQVAGAGVVGGVEGGGGLLLMLMLTS